MGPRLVVLDISNPAKPRVVGQTGVLPGVVRDVAVSGGYAYVADGEAGLLILQIPSEGRVFLPLILNNSP